MKQESQIEMAINALLSCPRIEDAARQCGISRTTLWRLSQNPDFQFRLREARSHLSEEIVTSLSANSLEAVNTLRAVMLNKRATPSVRANAASRLIELSIRAKQQLDVEQRLIAVELALRTRKENEHEAK